MAKLYITEYAGSTPEGGLVSVVQQEPAIATQAVTFTGTAAASAAFNPATRYIEMSSDSICSVRFGSAPVATLNDTRIALGTSRLVSVVQNFSSTAQLKVSAIVNT